MLPCMTMRRLPRRARGGETRRTARGRSRSVRRRGRRAAATAPVSSGTSTSRCPALSTRITSPSRTRASGPPACASGVTWIAAGTLPEAPDMRPSVTSATRKPRSWSTPSDGVSLCSSGMPFARGPWMRDDDHHVAIERAGFELAHDGVLVREHARGRLDDVPPRVHGRHLDDRAAEVAGEHTQAAARVERRGDAAQHGLVVALAPRRRATRAGRRRGTARACSARGRVPRSSSRRRAADPRRAARGS